MGKSRSRGNMTRVHPRYALGAVGPFESTVEYQEETGQNSRLLGEDLGWVQLQKSCGASHGAQSLFVGPREKRQGAKSLRYGVWRSDDGSHVCAPCSTLTVSTRASAGAAVVPCVIANQLSGLLPSDPVLPSPV